jgi:hypothetical protein
MYIRNFSGHIFLTDSIVIHEEQIIIHRVQIWYNLLFTDMSMNIINYCTIAWSGQSSPCILNTYDLEQV